MGWFKRTPESPSPTPQVTKAEKEVAEARRNAAAARMELQNWRDKRPHAEATGRAIRDQMERNHLSQLLLASMRGN